MAMIDTVYPDNDAKVRNPGLSVDDVKALRKADMASFHWKAEFKDWQWVGDAHVSLTKRIRSAGPLTD